MSASEREFGHFRASQSECPFENLVALHVRWLGNRLEKKFPLGLVLEVEEHQLVVPMRPSLLKRISNGFAGDTDDHSIKLRIKLRHCYVRYHSVEIEVLAHTKYESSIHPGQFDVRISEKRKRHAGFKAGLELHAGVDASAAGVGGKVAANADGGAFRRADRDTESTSSTRPEIYEVRAVPNGWRVGDPQYSDPISPSGALDGRYFDRPVKGMPHTCEAEFRDSYDKGEVTFVVTVRDGLRVERITGQEATRTEAEAAAAAMRDRIASIRLERHLRKNGTTHQRNEIPLMAVSCVVVRSIEEHKQAEEERGEASSRGSRDENTRSPRRARGRLQAP